MVRILTIAGAVAALVACQEPFGADRHDLVDDRVAALIVEPPGGPPGTWVTARAAIVVGGRPWSDTPVALRWAWVDDVDAAAARTAADPVDAMGPDARLRIPPGAGDAVLSLLAEFPSGFVERAIITVPRQALAPLPPIVSLSPTARVAAPDDTIALEATFAEPVDPPPRVRWMATGGVGTFVEQTRTTTTWIAAEVRFDDGEEALREPSATGPLTVLALAIRDTPGNAVRAENLWLGDPSPGVWLADGRWLPADTPVPPGEWGATLVADDTSPWGLALEDLGAPTPGLVEPLDLDALLYGRLLREDLVGRQVTVDVAP